MIQLCLGVVEDWLKMVAPHLALADYIEAIKGLLSYGHPVVALTCKKYNRQLLDLGEYTIQRHTVYLYAGCGNKRDVQVQGNPLAALGYQLRDDGLWVHKAPIHRI